MGGPNFRNAYEFDPESYGSQGGGLLGILQAMMPQGQAQPGGVSGSTPNGAPEYNPDSYGSPQGGLFGRLLAMQAEQSRYQPIRVTNGPEPSVPENPSFTQISQAPNGAPLQAQQPSEAAAARLAGGGANLAGTEAAPLLDPADIARSAGIGVINGMVNTVGLLGKTLTGFGYLPDKLVHNGLRRAVGLPDLPADERDSFETWAPDLQHSIEKHTANFINPRAGRAATQRQSAKWRH
jgi:hypothetical protein